MPREVNGVWISDDGKWTWDGRAWHPTRVRGAVGKRGPWRLLLIVLLVLFAIGLVFAAMTNFGWLIAIVGVLSLIHI